MISDSKRVVDTSCLTVNSEGIMGPKAAKITGKKVVYNWLQLLEICSAERRPPMTPAAFSAMLKTKTFTNKADPGFVDKKYEQTFNDVFKDAKVLSFSELKW